MAFYKSLMLVLSVIVLITGSAYSQAAQKKQTPPPVNLKNRTSFEVSPFTGSMSGGGLFGLRLVMNYSALNFELSGEQVLGKAANLYPLTLNIALNLSTKGPLLPYGIVGGGLFMTVPTNAIGAGTVSTVGVNFGGGARYYFSKNVGIRLEARQYMTNVANELTSKDEILAFQEVSIGVTFLFQ